MHKDVHCFRVMCGTVLRADEALGAGEERTEMYMKYIEGVPQLATPQGAKSQAGAAGFAGRQGLAVR